jgi:hypothetical protein
MYRDDQMSKPIYFIDNDALVKIYSNWRSDGGASGRAILASLTTRFDIRITDYVRSEAQINPDVYPKDAAVRDFIKNGKITEAQTSIIDKVRNGNIPAKNAGEVSIVDGLQQTKRDGAVACDYPLKR